MMLKALAVGVPLRACQPSIDEHGADRQIFLAPSRAIQGVDR